MSCLLSQHSAQGLRARGGQKAPAATGISNIPSPFQKGVTNTLGDKQKHDQVYTKPKQNGNLFCARLSVIKTLQLDSARARTLHSNIAPGTQTSISLRSRLATSPKLAGESRSRSFYKYSRVPPTEAGSLMYKVTLFCNTCDFLTLILISKTNTLH